MPPLEDDSEDVEIESPAVDEGDLRAELSAAWAEHEDDSAPEPAEETEIQETPSARLRGADGKFLPKQAQQSSGEEQTTEKSEQVIPAATATPEAQAAKPPVLAPASWAAEKKQQWAKVPRDLQEEIARVDLDTRRQLQRVSEEAAQVKRTWAEVEQTLAPRMEQFRAARVTPGQVFANFMQWQDKLDADPKSGLRELAQTYGLDIRQLAEEEAQRPQDPPYVREMRQQIQQMQGLLQNKQQAEQQAKAQAIQNELAFFASEKDAQGNLLRPYLDAVADDMAPILQTLRAQHPNASAKSLLEQAYSKAIWLNEQTREIELTKQRAASQSPERIERAKRASKLVNGHARANHSERRPDDIRGELEAAWAEHEGKI